MLGVTPGPRTANPPPTNPHPANPHPTPPRIFPMRRALSGSSNLWAALAVAALVSVPAAVKAGQVTYSDTGTFNNTTSSTESFTVDRGLLGLTAEDITVSYTTASSPTITVATPGIGDLGTFSAMDAGDGTGIGSVTGSFALTVNQTVPSSGAQTDAATLTGTYGYLFGIGGTTFTFTFDSDTFQIGSVSYTLGTMDNGQFTALPSDQLSLTVPITGHDAPSVDLVAEVNSVPEPSTLAAACSAAVVLGGAWWRRRRAA